MILNQITEFFINNKNKIIGSIAVIAVLAFAFLWGGNAPNKKQSALTSPEPMHPKSVIASKEPIETLIPTPTISAKLVRPTVSARVVSPTVSAKAVKATEKPLASPVPHKAEALSKTDVQQEAVINDKNDNSSAEAYEETKEFRAESEPEGISAAEERSDFADDDKKLTCRLSVRCDTILDNLDFIAEEKLAVIPHDGVVFEEQTVEFNEGESAFQVLRREMKRHKIHFEFENVPLYNSSYIEGINNIYEFDCGELSGWMYKVNGWFPNYGCSQYVLKHGDLLEFVYTCDLGRDVGGEYASGGNR